jgi:hypothetical protein
MLPFSRSRRRKVISPAVHRDLVATQWPTRVVQLRAVHRWALAAHRTQTQHPGFRIPRTLLRGALWARQEDRVAEGRCQRIVEEYLD